MNKLSQLQKDKANLKILYGCVDRASNIALFFALSFSLYGVTSFEFISQYDPMLSMWSNVWPRLLFNGVPFLGMYFYFKNYKVNTVQKIWLWILGYPIIFHTACWIHVWPLVLSGHPQLYLHVHGANFMTVIMATSLVAPPPRYLVALVGMTVICFTLPMVLIFVFLKDYSMLRFFLNDAGYAYFLGIVTAYSTYRLRSVLATEDVLNQDKIGKFVGRLVSESIFEKNETLLDPRKTNAFLISMDVRGFTQLMKEMDPRDASRFKENYHRLVARVVGECGGFIHKTHGDGHLISLGLMNPEVDLSDVPDLQRDLKAVEGRRQADFLKRAISIFESVYQQFEKLKEEFSMDHQVCVCASIDYGEIGLNILGDPNVRLEFDIEGMVVIRCSRLEAYTKTLRTVLASDSSFLVLSSVALSFWTGEVPFEIFETRLHPIKDFPDQASVAYREYKSRRFSRARIA